MAFASLQASLAKTLIDLQKRILYIGGVPVKRRARHSGGHSVRLAETGERQ